ncbi:MAG: twin-arginine translocase TatA/TatE family subunit [Gammaproteobacteria bacterium]|nr:twin-arginine translocase TatA/TatE family subunit [Gammaproteobacteria bacterium]MBU1556132.1 twin-arginine translocase TatA/TatE family subunit [Gammaproteobacteria bacterium]MBU2070752.1 twin-arginine translocase TatA/TatE family subunit [Gammaproteobacteria bacterium]MBU2182743.1 twin-arginine translocase TatA/TatE family subunit [Gammaproteobacteria bacterium]MBU2206015.1 twin-arginine translocase TatA/TatE family subunit [Gammaproteobacteria bacterium]
MGFSGIGIWQLAIVLLIVVLLFGSKKLRHLGADLGAAVAGLRRGLTAQPELPQPTATTQEQRHEP